MPHDSTAFFSDAFYSLTSRKPYPWQVALFRQMMAGAWPELLPLPTGSGKTSVLVVWLLALAWSLRGHGGGVPRRLVWVINRRVVVDQVTDEVNALIDNGLDRCPEVRDILLSASATQVALVASTLRGQRADDGDWAKDPSAPAILVGTVDMIGSRLLFRGYGASGYHRPLHAGLLGVDTLIVNDESHLSPAFAQLLNAVASQRPAAAIPGKAFRLMLLSATPVKSDLRCFEHSPLEDAAASEEFRKIFEAPKSLSLYEAESKDFDNRLFRMAVHEPRGRTIVFVEKPEKAAQMATRLEKDGKSVCLLTGTMRGHERDRLTSNPVFLQFLKKEPPNSPVFLVATSAAEVGVNLSSERLMTGLVTADRLLQRFGRLNRFGEGSGEADVLYSPQPKDRLAETLAYLRELDGDVSCQKVWMHPPRAEACTEQPRLARLHPFLIDAWAQTTHRDRVNVASVDNDDWHDVVPRVAPWLHGKSDGDPPETELAWRADVEILTRWRVPPQQIESLLAQYPILARERLREPSQRILDKLKQIVEEHGGADTRVIHIDSGGTPRTVRLETVIQESDLNYETLLLPENFGRLVRGMFQPGSPSEGDARDVADEGPGSRRRYLVDGAVGKPLAHPDDASEAMSDFAVFAKDRGFRAPLVIPAPEGEGEEKALVYFSEAKEKGKLREIGLTEHQHAVAKVAEHFAELAGLDAFSEIYRNAGQDHDSGKWRGAWQQAFGGSMEKPIAKSANPKNLRILAGYRHELGSLLDVLEKSPESGDLLLHLIASHHKGARPYFTEKQLDKDSIQASRAQAFESARRFSRLQRQFGPWGLAYLEAVFKCADAHVSTVEGGGASE